MSANPQAMAAMLASSLGGQGQAPMAGGLQTQQSPAGSAAQLLQKVMLMKALQGAPQTPQAPPTGPGGFPLPPGQALPQQMNAQPVPGTQNA